MIRSPKNPVRGGNLHQMKLTLKLAAIGDVPALAMMNRQLIIDEGHRNPMTLEQLEQRMANWLADDYEATMFSAEECPVGYALYRRESEWMYVRQFLVVPDYRRQGIGRTALRWLTENVWQGASRLRLDVLISNINGIAFWRSVGFHDYCLTMECDISR